ncbi:MAG TPA: TetR/AcrR family transcriptional regulator [Acidimicrobiales bacterium]
MATGGAATDIQTEGPAAPGPENPDQRPMRADAVKNRARILQAAEEVFAANGLSAPIDLVAEEAGVGVGTVYRHFPTKEALFEAIVLTGLQELVEAATAPADDQDAGEAFYAFIRTFASKVSIKHDLIDALSAAGIDIKSQCAMTVEDLEAGVERMTRRAEVAGAVRPGVTTQEVIGLVVGVCKAVDMSSADDASRDRMVDIVCDGLRAPSPT